MDSTPPPPPSQTKSGSSRPSKLRPGSAIPPALSLEIVPSSSPASTLSPRKPSPYTGTALPLHELLMLSPSPLKRSAASDDRKRCKTRSSRRSSRRRVVEQDVAGREEVKAGEDMEILVKPTKKRHGERRSRKDKSVSVQSMSSLRTSEGEYGYNMDAIGEFVNDLVMWKDVAKSSLWFGFGSLCFLSSCFARGITFSIFSFLSQVGLVFLGASFFSNSMRQRDAIEGNKNEFKLKEDDILRACRLVLPAANLVLSKTRHVFSGEPAMTLKVAPILLVGVEYGHHFTLWRLCALGFFISFTGPKSYSTYSSQLSKKVDYLKSCAMDAWKSCKHKKIVAGSAVTAFWNLTSIRTRIFAAFLCVVIIRYRKQHSEDGVQEEKHENALVVAVEIESSKKQHLL